MKKLLKKRTGFTLVELLIVIIIIGILAGAMLLVAGSGQDKAEATKIVSDLRTLKAAVLMYWADNPNAVSADIDGKKASDLLKPYLDRETMEPTDGVDYVLEVGSGDAWMVGFVDVTYPPSGVQTKLAEMKNAGLYQSTAMEEYKTGTTIYMRAR